MASLAKIKDAGFSIKLVGDKLSIIPASKLNTEQREFLKSHKTEIVGELKNEQAANDSVNLEPIEKWQVWIGEDDQEIIDEVLTKCRADSETLEYFLMRATEVPTYFDPKPESEPEKHVCQECQHWQRDQIGDGTGLGLCELNQKQLPWPNQTACSKFEGLVVNDP
jgi:hypothetical protein